MGHVYLMVDASERADKRILFKLGMTGATQTPMDRLMTLRTGNPNLTLTVNAMVKSPRTVESRLFEMALAIARPVECMGSTEFFLLHSDVSLF